MTAEVKPKPKRAVVGPVVRAQSMSSEGYRVEPMGHDWCWRIMRPSPTVDEITGDPLQCYYVRRANREWTCDCKWAEVHGGSHHCKHIEFLKLTLRGCRSILLPCVDLTDIWEEGGIDA